MKNSLVYRTLQVASAVGAYSMISIWASTKHVGVVSHILAELDSLLVILGIAVALPYFCFKALSKLYTPPKSRNFDESSQSETSVLGQDPLKSRDEENIAVMQYRGSPYKTEDLTIKTSNYPEKAKVSESQPVIKYRGVNISSNTAISYQDDAFSNERDSQKSAKPKERIKYRGSYVD